MGQVHIRTCAVALCALLVPASFIGVGVLLLVGNSWSPAPRTPPPACLGLNDEPPPTQCNTVPLAKFTWTRLLNTQLLTLAPGDPVQLGAWPYGESQKVWVPKDRTTPRRGKTYAPNETKRALDDCKQLCVNLPDCIAVYVQGFEVGAEFLECTFALASFMPLHLRRGAFTLDYKPFDPAASEALISCPSLYLVVERLPSLAPGLLNRAIVTAPYNCSYPDFAVTPPPA